jgi:hypothetical protein
MPYWGGELEQVEKGRDLALANTKRLGALGSRRASGDSLAQQFSNLDRRKRPGIAVSTYRPQESLVL